MTELHEHTELFAAWAMSEAEYRDELKSAGCPPWMIEDLVADGISARLVNEMKSPDRSLMA